MYSADHRPPHQRVLVTGGSGFIGTNVVEALLGEGRSVMNVDIAPPRIVTHNPCWRATDILDPVGLRAAFADFRPDLVLHLAARTDLDERRSLEGYAANILGVSNVIDAIERTGGVDRSFFASSRLVCRIGYVPRDDEDCNPTTLYGESKVEGERLVRVAGDRIGAWTLLRFTSIWGPWFAAPYNDYFRSIQRGLYVHPGRLNPRKSFGYVRNTVYQIERLATAPLAAVAGRTLWIADYPPLDIRTWAALIADALGSRPVRSLPLTGLRAVAKIGDLVQRLRLGHAPLTTFRLNNLTTDMVYDTAPLEALIGPLPYDLGTGVRETVAWLKKARSTKL